MIVRRVGLAGVILTAGVQMIAPAFAQKVAPPAAGAGETLAADLNETIARVPVTVKLVDGMSRTGDMIITHYRPQGGGPFPLVVMSHGRAGSAEERAKPERQRFGAVARYWVRRGFAVVVPTRLGYGATGIEPDTEFSGKSCDDRSYVPMSEAAAHQIRTAVDFGKSFAWVDAAKIILMGQSVGGFSSTVANAKRIPGVIAAINSAGGAGANPKERAEKPCAPEKIAAVYAAAGKTASTPMLWFYSENDKSFGAQLPRTWHKAYTGAGGKAEFVMLAPNGEDGHRQLEILGVWRPTVDRFIAGLGFAVPRADGAPAATNFAPLSDASKLPSSNRDKAAEAYEKFLAADLPRAFAIGANGNGFAWVQGQSDALARALARCKEFGKADCKAYAVDDAVVWKP